MIKISKVGTIFTIQACPSHTDVKLKDCYLANQDDNVEELTEEEVDGILVKLVVDMLDKVVKKLDKLLTVIFNDPA